MRIIDVEQGSPEWFEIRKLKLTGSNAQAIAANAKGLDTYVMELCAESISAGEKVRFSNEETERGKNLEAEARRAYESFRDVTVSTVGFVEMDEFVGCSPDGLIGDDGGLELKCNKDRVHFELLLGGRCAVDTGHIWQMQMSMLVTGRKWWDYACYNPNFKKQLIVHRFERDLQKQESLMRGIKSGKEKIKEILAKMEELCL